MNPYSKDLLIKELEEALDTPPLLTYDEVLKILESLNHRE